MKIRGEYMVPVVCIIVASLIFIPFSNPRTGLSCGQGTVLFEEQCVVEEPKMVHEGSWVEIEVEFNSSIIHVNKGDYVRLFFNSTSWDHYAPDTLLIPEYDINISGLRDKDSTVVEFVANKEGVFSYYSEGLCRVDIPGAGEVDVDCSIFCGETNNERNGNLVVEGDSNYSIPKTAKEIGLYVCSLIGNYCD